MKCYVNFEPLKYNPSGSRKKWFTDGVKTYTCSMTPAYFIWEKNTKHNNYNGYSGYVSCKYVELVE